MDYSRNPFDRLLAQSALIIGAASGIGRAFATILADTFGCSLVLADMSVEGLEGVRAICTAVPRSDQDVLTRQVDVCDPNAVTALLAEAASSGIRLVIHTAGRVIPEAGGAFPDDAALEQLWQVNTRGSANVLRAAGAAFASSGGRSNVVLMGSVAAVQGLSLANRAAYIASKEPLRHLVMTAAADYGRNGTSFMLVNPGRVLTELVKGWLLRLEEGDARDEAFRAGCATQSSGVMLRPGDVVNSVLATLVADLPLAMQEIDLSDGWAHGFCPYPNWAAMPNAFGNFYQAANAEFNLGLSPRFGNGN